MIFPKPQRITENAGRFAVKDASMYCTGIETQFIKDWCHKNGLSFSDKSNIIVKTVLDESRNLTYVEKSRKITGEKYIINSNVIENTVNIEIIYAKKHGLWHALNAIKQQIKDGEIIIGGIEDYPLFYRRGFIEGFYGKPWSPKERMDMLQLMAAHRMNTYYYGPKDDPYHRDKWKELYPEKELLDLKVLIDLSQDCFVDFYFCIAPGLSIRYTSEEDYRALFNKIMQIYRCGVKNFGLLLDDIPENLHFRDDVLTFGGETVNAHIWLANKLFADLKEFDRDIKLTVCPLQYNGKGDEYFISKLGQGIEPGIDLFWTGRNICSQELTVPEAIVFMNSTYHKPLYWDNFPVNDAEMYNEMHLGYITGRDPDLYRYSEGIISNCMEFCECSKIPLLTVADYLWNPEGYNYKDSWDYAICTVVGEGSELFKYFADNLLSSCLKVSNSPILSDTFSKAQQELRGGNIMGAFELIIDYKKNLTACCEMLKTDERKIFVELKRWSKKMILCCDILNLSFEYLTDPNEEIKTQIKNMLDIFIGMPEVLTDFSFKSAVDSLLNGEI